MCQFLVTPVGSHHFIISIRNFFLAAQAFFRSLLSAIFLFLSITNSQANIIRRTITIAAELADDTHLVGQCEISHPVARPPDKNEDMSSLTFETISPTMSAQIQNVLFDAMSKGSYENFTRPSIVRILFFISLSVLPR